MSGTSKPDLCYQERGRKGNWSRAKSASNHRFFADANKDGRVVYA